MKKFLRLPLSYETLNFDSDRFMKLRVKVMHNGLNLNYSSFSDEAIEKAAPSIANIPLLAFVKKTDGSNDKDFAGHEFEIKLTENGIEYVYLGRPIGMIPETNNYSYEEDETGRKFVYVDGYIWKDYANDALEIIERDNGKKVSMEIRVNSYSDANSAIEITDYKYTGVALLGEEVNEAMLGARADIAEFSEDEVRSFVADFTEKLQAALAIKDAPEVFEVEEPAIIAADESIILTATEIIDSEDIVMEITPEIATEIVVEPIRDFEAEIAELNAQISTLTESLTAMEAEKNAFAAENEALKAENANLLTYKQQIETSEHQAQLEELVSQFADLEEEEVSNVLAATQVLSEVELQLFALRGKKTSTPTKHVKTYEVFDDLIRKSSESNVPSWADLIVKKNN